MIRIDVFNLFAKISLNSKEFDSGMDKAKSRLSNFGSSVKSALSTAAKVSSAAIATASGAAVALAKTAVDGYSEYEQLVGGVDKLFGDASQKLQEYAAEAYKTSGMSANEYMEQATSFSAALINSLGGDTAKAADATDVAMRAIADNFNTFGSDIQSVQNAFQGFAKQNYTMLDNLKLGYGGTKTEMERLISDANEYARSIGEASDLSIDSFADIVQAIDLVQKKQGIAGSTAKEASKTISGSIGMVKAAWKNLVVGFANPSADLGALIENMVDSATTAFQNLLPTIQQALLGIGSALEKIAPIFVESLPAALQSMIPALLSAATTLVESLVSALPSIVQVLVEQAPIVIGSISSAILEQLPTIVELGLSMIVSLANGIAENLPELIPSIVGVILQIVDTLTNPETISQLVDASIAIIMGLADGLIDALPELINRLPKIIENIVSALIENAPKLFNAAKELIVKLGEGLINNLPELFKKSLELVNSLANDIINNAPEMLKSAAELVTQIAEGIVDNLPTIVEKGLEIVTNLVTSIIDSAPEMFRSAVKLVSEFLKNIDLNKVFEKGKTIVLKIVSGIGNNLKNIGKAALKIITHLGNAIADLWSDILDIGKNIVTGIWEGIKSMGDWLYNQVSGFFGGIVDSVCDYLGIASPSKVFRDEVGQYISLGVAAGIAKTADKAVKAADDLAKDVYTRSKEWADRQTKYMELSLDDQIEIWETIQSQFIAGSKQYLDAEDVLFDLRKNRERESYETSKKWLSRQVDYFGMSTNEQIAYWEKLIARQKEGTYEYEEAEDNLLRLRKQRLDEQARAEEEFKKNVVDIWSNIDKLEEDYQKRLESRADQIFNTYKLFDEVPERQSVSSRKLLSNLRDQVRSIDSFYANLQKLADRGVGEALVEDIRQMGPQAADQLQALLGMSEDMLDEYAGLYQEKQQLANKLATNELENFKKETNAKIQEQMENLESIMFQTAKDSETWGFDLMQNFISGIEAKEQQLQSTLERVAGTVRDYIGFSEPKKGPLSRFHTFAPDMMELFAKGIRDNEDVVTQQIARSFDFGNAISPKATSQTPTGYGTQNGSYGLGLTRSPQIEQQPINITLTMDGATLAHIMYRYNQDEASARGGALI